MQVNGTVGIIGLVLMGTALSKRLIGAKVPVVVGFDIEPARCEKLKALGGLVATSVHELADRSRAIIVAVYSGEQVEALFGELGSGAGSACPTVVCTTTCAPDEIARLAQRATGLGIPFVEAPISGTSAEVREGAATALLAGETGVIDTIGKDNRAALAEGVVFAECLGLDGQNFLKAAREPAAYSRVMDSKGDKMLARDFQPRSHISQTLKDAELFLKEAQGQDLHLPMTLTQAGLLRTAIALKGPDSDGAAVIEAIRRRAASSEVSQ
jgi:3-hydroxyisobutyrate dehydrogenase-like beta-hydroxyacid dehydrogenase